MSKIDWPDSVPDGSAIDWDRESLLNRWYKTFGNTEETAQRFCECYDKSRPKRGWGWSRRTIWNRMMDELGYTEKFND